MAMRTIPDSPENSRTKLADVARLAKVSVSTASRALTRPEMVSRETREAVQEAAMQAGYQPNLIARSLRTHATKAIFVLLPGLESPFFPEIIRGLDWVAHERGYSLMLGLTGCEETRQASYLSGVQRQRADGIIVLDCQLTHLLRTDGAYILPVVQVLDRLDGLDCPSVSIDDRSAARLAMEHLLGLGHRRIAHISGLPQSSTSRARLDGYLDALAAAGIAFDESLVVNGSFSIDGGKAAASALLALAQRPTAIFAANDESAIGASILLKTRGLSVPGDMSIVGFDDIEHCARTIPPLTTVRQPRFAIGMAAMSLLLDVLAGKELPERHIVLPVELVVRQSTAAPKAVSQPS